MDSEASVQRQIELQSSDDLAYLVANARRAAQGHLNDAFPPMEGSGGEEDELRVQIERYVNEYITKTFTQSSPNLSINGLPADASLFDSNDPTNNPQQREPQVEYEPWDARLRQRVEDLARQEEELLNDIAALKKSVPAQVAGEHARRFREAAERDDEAMGKRRREEEERVAAMARAPATTSTTGGGGDAQRTGCDNGTAAEGRGSGGNAPVPTPLLDVGRLERQEAVERAHKDAVVGLGRVKREMPSTVARMERARVAGEYVVTERS